MKKAGVELELSTDADVILVVQNSIRGGIRYAVQRYAEANKKYTKGFDPSTELPYLMYWDVNNLCGWAMSQKLFTAVLQFFSVFERRNSLYFISCKLQVVSY